MRSLEMLYMQVIISHIENGEILLTVLCEFEAQKSSNNLKLLNKTKISTTEERIL